MKFIAVPQGGGRPPILGTSLSSSSYKNSLNINIEPPRWVGYSRTHVNFTKICTADIKLYIIDDSAPVFKTKIDTKQKLPW
jgi:hypothetical protein